MRMILAETLCIFQSSRKLKCSISKNMYKAWVTQSLCYNICCNGRILTSRKRNDTVFFFILCCCLPDKLCCFINKVIQPVSIGFYKPFSIYIEIFICICFFISSDIFCNFFSISFSIDFTGNILCFSINIISATC